jgi:hypothetical protein
MELTNEVGTTANQDFGIRNGRGAGAPVFRTLDVAESPRGAKLNFAVIAVLAVKRTSWWSGKTGTDLALNAAGE